MPFFKVLLIFFFIILFVCLFHVDLLTKILSSHYDLLSHTLNFKNTISSLLFVFCVKLCLSFQEAEIQDRVDGVHPSEFLKGAADSAQLVERVVKEVTPPSVSGVVEAASESLKEAAVQLLTNSPTTEAFLSTTTGLDEIKDLPLITREVSTISTTDHNILSQLSTTLAEISTSLTPTTLQPSATESPVLTDASSTLVTVTEPTTTGKISEIISDIFAETTDVETAKSRIAEIFSETTTARAGEVTNKIEEIISEIFTDSGHLPTTTLSSTSSTAPEFFWEFNTDVMASTSTIEPTISSITTESASPVQVLTDALSTFATTTEPTTTEKISEIISDIFAETTDVDTAKSPIANVMGSTSAISSTTTESLITPSTLEPYSRANHSLTELFNPLKDTVSSLLEYSKELLADNVDTLSTEPPADALMETSTTTTTTTTSMIEQVATEAASTVMGNVTMMTEEMATNLTAVAQAATHVEQMMGINLTFSSSSLEDNLLTVEDLAASMDTLFLIVMSIFIMMLQLGFAFLEAGSVRSKNVTNILIKNVLLMLISAIAFWLFGYMIGYSDGTSFLGLDVNYLAYWNLPDTDAAHWFFSFAFTATAATIVSGAVAERCQLTAYFLYSALISGFIYPVAVHWAWTEQGWLGTVGYQDFAGSGVVHLLGGICALVGAITLGPRLGRFGRDGSALEMPGHSVPLTTLGGMLLFVGFFAFNGGTQGSISSPESRAVVQLAVMNTIISGAAGGLLTLLWFRFYLGGTRKWSLVMTINGTLAGMIAICASCNRVDPQPAFLVGLLAALSYTLVHHTMLWFKVDDPLDAVAVHAGGGALGVLIAPFVFRSGGVFDPEAEVPALGQVWAQVAGVLVISGWGAATSAFIFGTMRLAGWLRVSQQVELGGNDAAKHEASYPTQESIELGGEKGLELMAKSWRSPDTVEFLKFRKKSDSSLDSEMMGGLVNEGFEEDFVDGNESVSQTKEDGTQETHFNGGWKEVNKEVENSIANAKAEKEAEADEGEKVEYGEESKIDFGEEDSEEEVEVEEEGKKVEHLDLSHMMDMERWSNLPIGLEYSGDSRESSVI